LTLKFETPAFLQVVQGYTKLSGLFKCLAVLVRGKAISIYLRLINSFFLSVVSYYYFLNNYTNFSELKFAKKV